VCCSMPSLHDPWMIPSASLFQTMQVMHRDTVNLIAETTGAALFTKGVYVPPGKQVSAWGPSV
jgi:hypothetical protein